jgi:hypothetical protein
MKRSPLSLRIALAVGASCAMVVLLEVGARVFFPGTAPRLAMYRPQPDVVYELVPSFHGVGPRGERVRINAAGLRGADLGRKPPGSLRVLIVGDSFTFGLGVSEEESLPGALARAIDAARSADARRAPDAVAPAVEVLNAGVPGYNLFQERRLIDRRAAELQADVIVLVMIENDLYNVDGSDFIALDDGTLAWRPGSFQPDINVNPFAALSGPWLWLQLHSVAFREASFRAIRARLELDGDRELEARARMSETSTDLPSRLLRGEDDADTRPRWNAAAIELRAATAAASALGAPLIVVLFPRPEQLFSERLRAGFARLAALAAAAGARVVDPSASMARAPDRIGLYLFPGDHHPGPRGYDLVAGVVAPVVSAAFPGTRAAGVER